MSFKVRAPIGKYYADVASNLGAPNPLTALSVYPAYFDPFIWALTYNVSYSHGTHRIDDLLGCFTGSDRDTRFVFEGSPPENSGYSDSVDERRYGSVLTGFYRLLKTLNMEVTSTDIPGAREHNLVHVNPRGYLGPSVEADDMFTDLLYPGPFTFYAGPHWTPTNRLTAFGRNTMNLKPTYIYGSGSPANPVYSVGFYNTGNDLSPPHFNRGISIQDVLEAHASLSSGGGYTWTGDYLGAYPQVVNIYDMTYEELVPGYYRFEYSMMVQQSGSKLYWAITADVGGSLSLPTPDHYYDVVTGWESIQAISNMTCVYSAVAVQAEPGWATTVLPVIGYQLGVEQTKCDYQYTYEPYLLSRPVQSGIGPTKGFNFLPWWKSHVIPTGDHINTLLPDIRASAYQSTVDALNNFNDVVAFDDIQTLAKLRGLTSLVPAMSEGVSILRKLKGGDFASLKEIADFASSASLGAQFQTRPQIEFVREHLPEYSSALQAIHNMGSVEYRNVYGSFSYDFPFKEFHRSGCTLTTRTKLRIRFNGNAVAAKIFGVRRLGLLPSPSVLWDLTPWSFVANWFTGIGLRLRDIESIGMIYLLDYSYLVHSYTIDLPLVTEDFETIGVLPSTLSGEEGPPPFVRWMYRDVSTRIPPPRSGKFDFRRPTVVPRWTIVGPLIWQYLT